MDTMDKIFTDERTFADLGLSSDLLRGLDAKGYKNPTRIQGDLIPRILAGHDVLGQAKTGTGKTAAFSLPLISSADQKGGTQGLILCPTRELAVQVSNEIRDFARFTPIKVAAIYGGERRRTQQDHLQKRPHLIVGTPGRVLDFLGSGDLSFDNLRWAVLDEVDRMLDIGFRDDIRRILKQIHTEHQTIFVSATISPDIEALARTFMNDPEKIISTGGSLTVAQVEQEHLTVQRWDKKRLLVHLLKHEEPALTVVFCGTKREVDFLTEYLEKNGIDAHAIHGDMFQRKRDRVMKRFRDGQLGVLVASDVASRGLDVEGISHVINYDIPIDPEVYVHRIGRTARLDRGGIAWTFVTPDEGRFLTTIESLINKEIPKKIYDDFQPGPVPSRVRAERAKAEQQQAERQSQSRTRISTVTADAALDPTKFPGGVVPNAPPKQRLGGRVRRRRR